MTISNGLQLMDRQLFILGQLCMSRDAHSSRIKNLGSAESFLKYYYYAYDFTQCHMIGVTVCLYGYAVIM